MYPACSLIPLPDIAVLRARGPDATAFLHGQLTCDLHATPPQTHVLGAQCNAKGRVLHLFRLCRDGDDWLLLLPAALAEDALAVLRRFILRRKLSLALDPSLTASGLIAQDGACRLPSPGQLQRDDTGLLLGLPGTQPRALLLAAPQDPVRQGPGINDDTWLLLDITAGLPQVLPGASGLFVPQMLNLHALGAVSFNKGCYPGQEIVARMHYLGSLKRRMYLARIASHAPPKPGAELLAAGGTGSRAGEIVLAARNGSSVLALAVVQAADAVRPLQLKDGGAAVTVEEVPYPVPEGHAAPATGA
jgi:hypothetical protein